MGRKGELRGDVAAVAVDILGYWAEPLMVLLPFILTSRDLREQMLFSAIVIDGMVRHGKSKRCTYAQNDLVDKDDGTAK